jgi:hypothetical protein
MLETDAYKDSLLLLAVGLSYIISTYPHYHLPRTRGKLAFENDPISIATATDDEVK